MIQTYPDDCIQGIIEPEYTWWEECEGHEYRRGRLVWAFIPHVGQTPCTMIPIERGEDPTQHKVAKVRIEPLDIKSVIRYPKLPIPSFLLLIPFYIIYYFYNYLDYVINRED